MAHTSGNALVQWLVASLLIAMLGGAKAYVLCDIESNKLSLCYAAVTGSHPKKPICLAFADTSLSYLHLESTPPMLLPCPVNVV